MSEFLEIANFELLDTNFHTNGNDFDFMSLFTDGMCPKENPSNEGHAQVSSKDEQDLDFMNLLFGPMFPEKQETSLEETNECQDDIAKSAFIKKSSKPNQTPTFISISESEKSEFLTNMRNKNTVRKTESSLKQFQRWLSELPRNETRNITHIMPVELDNYIGSFLLSIRKSDGTDYEPDTLTSYHRGLDRYLRENKYPYSLVKDREFETSRSVLAAKRKELKQKGKGNKPHSAEPLDETEKALLFEKGLLGTDDPQKLSNLVWLNNTVLFGIRGGNENRSLKWGDIELKCNDNGREYIEFNERATKTRTGANKTETREFRPKQFPHDNKNTCPVFAYKEFARHRPLDMLTPDSPFYLAINHQRKPGSEYWFKSQAMGEHHLRGIMKKMAEKGGLQGRKTNHSARKTTCTKLLHSDIAPTVIQQLTGQKNVQSINNYAKASVQMQEHMSDLLSNNPQKINSTPVHSYPNLQTPQDLCAVPYNSTAGTQNQNMQHITNAMSLKNTSQFERIFPNATLLNCHITINNRVLSESRSPSIPKESPRVKRRRICPILDSDSD